MGKNEFLREFRNLVQLEVEAKKPSHCQNIERININTNYMADQELSGKDTKSNIDTP